MPNETAENSSRKDTHDAPEKIEKISLVFSVRKSDGTIEERSDEIHIEEMYLVDLNRALRNGKSLADALAFLADFGCKYSQQADPIPYNNRIGP